jgi:hypothetical protein
MNNDVDLGWEMPEEQKKEQDEEKRFLDLFDQWKSGTWFMSSASDIIAHPACQEIIAMGEKMIPNMLNLLVYTTRYNTLVWILFEITGENPVKPKHIGSIKNMAKDWIEWGKNKGLI